MENLELLLNKYSNDDRVLAAVNILKSEHPANIIFKRLVGAQESFVLAGTYLNSPSPIVYLANTKEEAAYIFNNVYNILTGKPLWFFPDSFKKSGDYTEINKSNLLQRSETINKIYSERNQAHIIVSYPEAICEKVVSPQVLAKHSIQLKIKEIIDTDFLIEILVEYGFESVDFVYEPGQFSIRGGIIDIFSYGSEWPFRIELFDDEIESIRVFNPITQLSIRNIASLSIVPNLNQTFSENQKADLFQVLPENTRIWIKDDQFLLDRIHLSFEKGMEAQKRLIDKEKEDNNLLAFPEFMRPKKVMDELDHFSKIFTGSTTPTNFEYLEQVDFKGKPQPSFNKNFKVLINNMLNNKALGIDSYLFTDNARQIKRFDNIFEDLEAPVQFHPVLKSIDKGFIDEHHRIACYTDHQIFQRFHKYNLRRGFTRDQAMTLKFLRELRPGDYVTHLDHGIGRYSGLEKIEIKGHIQESVRIIYQNNDILYVGIQSLHKLSKYVGREGTAPVLSKLGSDAWKNLKRRTKKKVKDIALELIKLYARRRQSEGFAFTKDGYLQYELEASFFYEDTPDQLKATQDVKADMELPHPMDRLICGDVGFGKTEVAIRAAFKAVTDGKQVAVLVPTTILALQHFKTFTERLDQFGINVDYLNRFRTPKEKKVIFESLKSGKIEIVIGTHALLNQKVGFANLGLLVVDEEQKFGVSAKEKLRNLKVNVDTLILTATPIPRTLQFSLMAARDLSIINTPPPNRQPIHTEMRIFNNNLIRDSIYYEVDRGGQVFFVHNRVKNLAEVLTILRRLCPDTRITMAHGQMDSKKLESALIDFIEGKYDVLLCTNIIETGLDIPNANTIIINNAHQFGLSDLHQLRGRVGRSNRKAYCYLFSPPLSTLTPDARKRLSTLEEFSDLGSGFNIAMRDLDIRGAGNLLGAEQSGFINEIGYDTYQKILEEAIQELKETEFKNLFLKDVKDVKEYVKDVQLETDIEMLIPDEYINNIQERLNLYYELDNLNSEDEIQEFKIKMEDRFGSIPTQVNELFEALRLRWIAKKLGFEKIVLKNENLRCFFVLNPQSSFYDSEFFHQFLSYLGLKGEMNKLSIKQSKKYLIMSRPSVYSLANARSILAQLEEGLKMTFSKESANT